MEANANFFSEAGEMLPTLRPRSYSLCWLLRPALPRSSCLDFRFRIAWNLVLF